MQRADNFRSFNLCGDSATTATRFTREFNAIGKLHRRGLDAAEMHVYGIEALPSRTLARLIQQANCLRPIEVRVLPLFWPISQRLSRRRDSNESN